MPRASRSSQILEMQKSADGSIDVFFGPNAPAGRDSNWVPTDPARRFELMFRLYAPTKALFDKAWVLPDVEKVAAESCGSEAMKLQIFVGLSLLTAANAGAFAQSSGAMPVGIDNFARAESDLYMGNAVKDGGFGKLHHNRAPADIDKQIVIRLNRDTLYSMGVFDLDAGPVTITLPDAGKRFMSAQVINEDHYVPNVFYGAGSHTLTRDNVGTRYALVGIRTLVDPNDPRDLQQVHALQDAMKVSQSHPGRFEVPNWDQASQKKVRDALLVLGSTTSGFKRAFGSRDQVDPVYHLIGTAMGWGGNPEKDATYLGMVPARNDGTTVYKFTVKDVPVDAFWSVSVYNAEGYFVKNPYDAYSLSNITAKKSDNGSVAVQFGGCDGRIPNCLPIMNGWNYTVRLYRPRAEILDGRWKFPEAQPANAAESVGAKP